MRTDQLPANELSGILNYMEKFLHAMIDIWEMRYRFFYFVINNRREKEYQSHLGVIIDYLHDVVKEIECPLRHKQLCGIICHGANLTKENQEKMNQILLN